MPRKQMNLIFPGKGLDKAAPYEKQPPYSTPDCQNVRLFDTVDGRATGGSRPGIGKAFQEELGSGNKVNLLSSVMKSDSSGFAQYAENFNITTLENNGWSTLASYSSELPSIYDPSDSGIVYNDETAKAGAVLDTLDPQIDETQSYTVEMEIAPYGGTFAGSYVLWAGMNDTNPDAYNTGIVAELIMDDETDSYSGSLKRYSGGSLLGTYPFTPSVGTGNATAGKFWILSTGTTIKVYWNGILLVEETMNFGATSHRVGFGMEATVEGGATMVSSFLVQYHSGNDVTVVDRPLRAAASNGQFYIETWEGVMEAVTSDLSLNASERLRCATAGNKLYIADHGDVKANGSDGVMSGAYLDAASVPDWSALGLDLFDYVVEITDGTGTVADGVYQIDNISAGTLELNTSVGSGSCSYRIQRGPKIFDPADNTLSLWVAEDGSVPAGATLIESYRGRIIMGVGRLWFMSKQFNPLNWDYGASDTDYTRAIAGQNAEAGQIGQQLVSIMPHHDDFLIFGCERSLWILRGDPAWPGSTLGPISKTVGCVGGDAWTETDDGSIVLLAHSGLFAIPSGGNGFPQPLSARLPRELKNLTKDIYQVSLEFEPYDNGVHVFVYQTGIQHTQWWLDWVTKGLYPSRHSLAHTPFSTFLSSGQVQDTTDVLIGCTDGYIRRFADRFNTDDGTEIESYVLIGPFKLGNGYVKEGSLEEMTATLNHFSGAVDWSIQVGQTSQGALLAETLDSGTWDHAGGLQLTERPRVRGESCILRIDNAGLEAWAMEDVATITETLDDQRML